MLARRVEQKRVNTVSIVILFMKSKVIAAQSLWNYKKCVNFSYVLRQ